MINVPSVKVKSQPRKPTAAAQPPKPATPAAVSSSAQSALPVSCCSAKDVIWPKPFATKVPENGGDVFISASKKTAEPSESSYIIHWISSPAANPLPTPASDAQTAIAS